MVVGASHIPVMLPQVTAAMAPRDGDAILDCTFGEGGYTGAFLETSACTVWAIDRDPEAVVRGAAMGKQYGDRLTVLCGCFGDMVGLLRGAGVHHVDGIVLDLGVSSRQIDDPERGFSFRADGPLDMRMAKAGMTAADVVNELAEEDLRRIIREFGEERAAKRIARAIVEARSRAPITRTGELAEIVRRVLPRARDGIDQATRTFQALRIHVNDELGEIDRGLSAAEVLLNPGGRLVVVSFHSLEDRRVKAFLRARSGGGGGPSRHLPERPDTGPAPSFRLLSRGTIKPSPEEIAVNRRSRSARLRAAERTAAPAWPATDAPHGDAPHGRRFRA
jgi:16S rRNA (cytosine1402-N4)-methyltransferase